MNAEAGAVGEGSRGLLYRFEAHAIVSADDKIADASGAMPPALRHPLDWARFQAALDRAALIVLGRRSHEATPNPKRRKRLVMSRQVVALEQRGDGWWWNPAGASLQEALAAVAPEGGVVAIPGGREVFDYFLDAGLDAFHLTRVEGLTLPGGVPVLSACADGTLADAVLERAGLHAGEREVLDAEAGVSVTVWRK
jgi:dihydrofolate reductase